MPTYEQLYHLNLSNLKAAADRWEETAGKFKELSTAFGDEVVRPFHQAGWTQPALTAAKADNDVRATQREFEDAHQEAKGIAGVLRTLHAELKKAKDDLHRIVGVEAEEQGLHVSATGTVTPRHDLSRDTSARHDPDGQAAIREQQQACDALARRLERVLQRAADADETACWALRRDLGGNTTDFNSKVVTSLDAADATRAAELGKKNAPAKTDGWVAKSQAEASGPGVGTSVSGPDAGAGKLGEAEAHADLGRASAEGSLVNGSFQLAGEAEAYAGTKAGVNGSVTNEGIQGQAGVLVGGEASAKGSAYVGPIGVYGRAEGLAGAEASANVGVGVDGVHLEGEALAGVKGGIAGGADIGGIGAGATAEGWAGPGAEASLNFGKDANGTWHFAPKVGVSPIMGGAVGFEVTIDPGKIAATATSAADVVGDTAGWVAEEVGSLF